MTDKKIKQARFLIDNAQRIVITTHQSPDGDAIGSSMAMYHYLKAKGKNVTVVVPNEYPEFLHWMEGDNTIVTYETQAVEARKHIREADLIFSLDYNILSRTYVMESALTKAKADFILIDHHQQPGDYPKVLFSDTSSCSTAQLVYNFIEKMGDINLINIPIAEGIYCGIMTDSGSFRFDNVKPETHRIAASLIEKGLKHDKIHRLIYDTNSVDRLRLLGYALSEKLIVLEGYHTAIITLTQKELDRFNFQPGDTEGIVNYALSIKGIKLAIFGREGAKKIKISFRSKGLFNVNKFARAHFNGGGHNKAAGGVMFDEMDVFIKEVIEKIKEYKDELMS